MKRNKMIKNVVIAVMLILTLATSTYAATYAELVSTKDTAHEIAEQCRELGFDENHYMIVHAQKMWHEADNSIQNEQYDDEIYYTDADAEVLAKVAFCEARCVESKTELACVMWTVLNMLDNGDYGDSILEIATTGQKVVYYESVPMISDFGCDLKELALDVLGRWNAEQNGHSDVGRVLPADYLWFGGDGEHNYFRNTFALGKVWNYSLSSPYEN